MPLLEKRRKHFNPRSPCGERQRARASRDRAKDFNPRSPCGERLARGRDLQATRHFNPRSPCGERLGQLIIIGCVDGFQSTLPLRGATPCTSGSQPVRVFQSTLPLRGATRATGCPPLQHQISIHAPLAGSDTATLYGVSEHIDFNPRSPCGERPEDEQRDKDAKGISIHAPLAGSDPGAATSCC